MLGLDDGRWVEAERIPESGPVDAAARKRSVFTTIAINKGVPLFLSAHLKRLAGDAAAVSLMPIDAATIGDAVVTGIVKNAMSSGVVRVIIAPRYNAARTATLTESILQVMFEPPRLDPGPVDLLLAELPLSAGRSIKLLWRHDWEHGLDRARAAGCFDVLATLKGQVLETSISNVFVIRKGETVTPPANGLILPGIARAHLLTAAGAGISEAVISVQSLTTARMVFGANSVRGLVPITRIWTERGEQIWSAGPDSESAFESVSEVWERLVEEDIASYDKGFRRGSP